ncbi:hypothetical protein ACMD2_07750, partial [Ananas comosus]
FSFITRPSAARSSRASENSPSSIPSPTYQCTNALFAYMRSNLWSIRENTSATLVEFEIMHTALCTLARSPPGTTVVDPALEAGGAPVDKLDGALGLDGGNGSIDVLGDDVAAIHEAAGHVLAMAGVTLGHHGGRLKCAVRNLGHGELLMVGLLSRDNRGVGGEHEVDARVGNQIGLELCHIHIQGAIKSQRGRAAADVINGLIVEENCNISVLQKGVGGENTVVGLDDRGGDLRRGIHTKARASASANSIEDEKALKPSAVVGKLPDAVEAEINNLLANCKIEINNQIIILYQGITGIVATGEVVGGIFLAADELLGVEELAVGSGPHLIDHSGFQINKHSTGDMLPCTCLAEEGVECIITSTDSFIAGHLAIRLHCLQHK